MRREKPPEDGRTHRERMVIATVPATRSRSIAVVAIRDMQGWRDRSYRGTLISDRPSITFGQRARLVPMKIRPDVGAA
jgi:hypothetical protein